MVTQMSKVFKTCVCFDRWFKVCVDWDQYKVSKNLITGPNIFISKKGESLTNPDQSKTNLNTTNMAKNSSTGLFT